MELPLFPLHTVLCPGIALPLHVFEDRYRMMVGRCLADNTPFGVVLIRDGREVGTGAVHLAGIGTMAEIREASRHSDGRFELLTVGTKRFRLQELLDGREPYLLGRVTPLDDELGDPVHARKLAERVGRRIVRYLELLQPADGEDVDEHEIQLELGVSEPEAEPDLSDPASGRELGPPAAPVAASEPAPRVGGLRPPSELPDPTDDDAAMEAATAAAERAARLEEVARRLTIPDDPTTLSYLLSGIVQVELPRRQVLLEAPTTEARLADLARLLDREVGLLSRRLRAYSADPRLLAIRRN
jgi:Lon protease-like protein